MSATPRTDAEIERRDMYDARQWYDFARQLETELAQTNDAFEKCVADGAALLNELATERQKRERAEADAAAMREALKAADDRLHTICGAYMAIPHGNPEKDVVDAIEQMGDDMTTVQTALSSTAGAELLAERDTLKAEVLRLTGAIPPYCPITGMPFFMMIGSQSDPDVMVPTYGGPFDSYTMAIVEHEKGKPLHEREIRNERYDHDIGGWIDGCEYLSIRLVEEGYLVELEAERDALRAEVARLLEDAERLDWLAHHHTEFAEELHRLGWAAPNDAQWHNLALFLRRLRHAVDEARKEQR